MDPYAPHTSTPRLPFSYTTEGDIEFQGQKTINFHEPTNVFTNRGYVDKVLQRTDAVNKKYIDEKLREKLSRVAKMMNQLEKDFPQTLNKMQKEIAERKNVHGKQQQTTDKMTQEQKQLEEDFHQDLYKMQKQIVQKKQ